MAAASQTSSNNESRSCLFCAEDMTGSTRRGGGVVTRSCCQNSTTCQSCFYRHIRSILEEATAGGQRKLTCPFGCGTELNDAEIRACFHQENFSFAWECFGSLVYCGCWLVLACFSSSWQEKSQLLYDLRWYYRHTEAEREDLRRYERWSLTTAFAQLNRQDDDHQVVLHCPAADCDYAWLVFDPAQRRAKQVHERQPVFLWYSPPRPEKTPADWVEPDFLNIEVTGWIPRDVEENKNDGRRMVCGKCAHVFCGLCRNPWSYERHAHNGTPCRRYARRLPNGWDNQDMVSWRTTRACPGCQMRTSRISGCNHMTCVCGREWCYVCGVAWNPMHYRCVDESGRVTADACTIL